MKHYALNRQVVAELREQKGMSQPDLAQRVGVSGGYLCLLENGGREPSASVALRIAEALGVTFADITVTKGLQSAQAS